MVIITALFIVKPGKETEFEVLAKSMVEKVQAEPGAMEYTLHKGAENPRIYFFYERYADQAACEAHMATPYLAQFSRDNASLIEGEVKLEVLREVSRIPVKDAAKRA